MVKKRGLPMNGELVVCKITKLNPNSAYAHLEEYDKEGMIHISEVSSGWVRDIRQFLRIGQNVIAKVTRIDEQHISLSLKRVDKKQENDKIKEYKLDQRAEKMLELAAAKLEKSLDQAYEEVGFLLQEKFGNLYEGFRAALENPETVKSRGVAEKWIVVLKEIAEKNIAQKEFLFRAKLTIRTTKPNGIVIIRNILKEMQKSGLDVHYIAAPNYLIKMRTKSAKKGGREFNEKIEKIVKSAKDAEIKYDLIRAE
jgi:translation initiation factor 2 subunit 1